MQEVNVQVAVRVRPLSTKERLNGEQVCLRITPGNRQLVLGRDRSFTFDNVLSSKTTQEEVYGKCVRSLVNGCFEGYNATVFAYGQTGSGKTYTIGGGNTTTQTEDEFGIVPRAIKHMFAVMKDKPDRSYVLKVTYIEVYKEDLHDLLDMDIHTKDIHIREDETGNTVIIGASEVECESIEEVMSCLERGSAYRHTGTTQMNEYSSRSHSVFTIFIEQKWNDDEITDQNANSEESGHYMCAKFHFVDLAGSERAHRTGNVGDRFKESVHINSGLLALGNVISALGDPKKKVSHIPYRESKITRLLKDSLGGNSNTWMLCCVSPASSNFDESLNALKYANRARNIKNKPIVNRDPHSIRFEEMQSEIKALREELQRQRSSVMSRLNANNNSDLQKSVSDATNVKGLEDKLIRIQTECSHYRMIADEAYKHLTDIQQRDILTQSLDGKLGDWLQLMEEIKNKVPNTLSRDSWENETIVKLQSELSQVKSDLTNDEEIFAEKVKEVNHLEERIAELESLNDDITKQLEDSLERQRQQDDQLVSQQVLIEELEFKLKNGDVEFDDTEDDEHELNLVTPKDVKISSRRAKSVPVNRIAGRSSLKQAKRNIHTSPALFSLERVMAGFRARSQLLMSRIEDSDEVMQQNFSDEDVNMEEIQQDNVKKSRKATFNRNAKSRGTYRVNKSRMPGVRVTGVTTSETNDDLESSLTSQTDDEKLSNLHIVHASQVDVNKLKSSTEVKRKHLKQTELDVRQSTQKMKDLEINIRMKEQLIRELVKTGRDSQMINKQNQHKIKALEKERLVAKQELSSLQKAMNELEVKEQQDKVNKDKLQGEFRRKMELAKTRIHALQKRQRDTERVATLTGGNDKRINDLEVAIERMRQQHDLTKNRLKDETDRKAKIQRELQRGQQQICELEMRNEQQKKILKIKTEEVAAVQRKFRSSAHLHTRASVPNYRRCEEHSRLAEQKQWLDMEMEKVLNQRKQMEILDKELGKREDIVLKKEAMLNEKSELEMKKLRSSQVLSRDMLRVSTKLESVERRIEEKTKEICSTPRDKQGSLKDEVKVMNKGRDQLRDQRTQLDDKLRDGSILSGQEERRLIELDEAVEALDAAIEYKNYHIENHQRELRQSTVLSQSDDNLLSKLKTLSGVETRILLSKYFDKVVDLREAERKKELECSELEMKVEEDERIIRELESSLEHSALERDRVLMQQQRDHEQKIQALMQQLSHGDSRTTPSPAGSHPHHDKEIKIQQLEKDLFYYKKTSRELKKKLKDIITNQLSTLDLEHTHKDDDEDGPITAREKESSMKPTATPRVHSRHTPRHDALPDGTSSSQREPVRISRKELRRLSDDEVSIRQSIASQSEIQPSDSLEANRNPWN